MSDKTLDQHLFVCTNHRQGKESCGEKGAQNLRDQLKAACKSHPELKSCKLRINSSGCLGHCNEGITAVLYPEQQWFTQLKEGDSPKLLEELLKRHALAEDLV